jgi:hypothetical protein
MSATHNIEFRPSGRGKAQCPSNPEFPDGIDVTVADDSVERCIVPLPYPAPECGAHIVVCKLCQMSVAVTAAGRPDDPRSVAMPCRITKHNGVAS